MGLPPQTLGGASRYFKSLSFRFRSVWCSLLAHSILIVALPLHSLLAAAQAVRCPPPPPPAQKPALVFFHARGLSCVCAFFCSSWLIGAGGFVGRAGHVREGTGHGFAARCSFLLVFCFDVFYKLEAA